MKQKHLLSLLQQGMTTVQVTFLAPRPGAKTGGMPPPAPMPMAPAGSWSPPRQTMPWEEAPPPAVQTYTYKAPIGLLRAGDTVVVADAHSPYGLALGNVHAVDPVARIDVDADFDYKWIVQRVDTTEYEQHVHEERNFADTMQAVEATRQREELMQTMANHLPQGSQAREQFDAAIAQFSVSRVTLAKDADALATADKARQDGFVGMACK